MARPQKEGLEYFPIVSSFDEKIELIIAEFGPEGLGIVIGLFQRIYINCYYIDWNEDTLMLFATKHINAAITRVNAVLTRCFDRNIFSKALYDKYKILTSRGIQKQYLKVCKDSRRKSVQFIKEYCLVDDAELTRVITEFISINAEETPKNDVLSTQRKEKEKERESKEKESKEESKEVSVSETHTQSLELCKYFEQLKPGESITAQLPTLKIWVEKYGFNWTKEVIQICVSKKNRLIIPWIEKVLQNWQSEGKPVESPKGNYKNKKPSGWDLKDQRQMDPELEKKLLENSSDVEMDVDPMELLKQIRGANKHE